MEIEAESRGTEGKIQAGKGLGAKIEVGRSQRIQEDEIKTLEEVDKGAAARGDDRVSPKGMATIKVANYKKGGGES